MSQQAPFKGPGRAEPPAEEHAERAIETMSFEAAMAELEALVQKLERGQLDLDASIAAYERGTALRRHCTAKLQEAQMRVEKLTFDKDGNAEITALDPDG